MGVQLVIMVVRGKETENSDPWADDLGL